MVSEFLGGHFKPLALDTLFGGARAMGRAKKENWDSPYHNKGEAAHSTVLLLTLWSSLCPAPLALRKAPTLSRLGVELR